MCWRGRSHSSQVELLETPRRLRRTQAASALHSVRIVVCYPSTRTARLASPKMSTSAKTRIVGSPVPRKEGVDKLMGRARYVDDIEREGMWHGATVKHHSARPHTLD